MTTDEFISLMNSGSQVPAESNVHRIMHDLIPKPIRIGKMSGSVRIQQSCRA